MNLKIIKNKHVVFLFLAFVLMIVSFFVIDKVFFPHNKTSDAIFSIVEENYSYAFVAICVFLAFSFFSRKYKSKMIPEILCFLIVIVLGQLLKFFIPRPRPIPTFAGNSFPSNHSLVVFSLLPFFKSWHYYIWLIICIFTAISRVYWQYHYFSDIFAGSFIGYGIGILIKKIYQRYEKEKHKKEKHEKYEKI